MAVPVLSQGQEGDGQVQSEGGSSLSKDSPVGRREPAPGQERSCPSVWRQGHGEPGTEECEADLDCIALGLGVHVRSFSEWQIPKQVQYRGFIVLRSQWRVMSYTVHHP